jgi:hypothetical protein
MATGCSNRKKRPLFNQSQGQLVDVLQLGSDGGSSLYQVQLNGNPDTDLHMTPYDDSTAQVRLIHNGAMLNSCVIRTVGDNWRKEAHRRVEVMLKKHYRDGAIVTWHTRGPDIEQE